MKIIIAPDKFKGSLSSFEVCDAIAKGIRHGYKEAVVQTFPMADGGDGFAAVLKEYGEMETVFSDSLDALERKIRAAWQWNARDKTAVIEVAAASGLVLLQEKERDPLAASTYGTGLLIKEAIAKGAKKILLGLGGSATNDAGTGILSALGFQFRDNKGQLLRACGQNLSRIKQVQPPDVITQIEIIVACDVQNTLFGKQGAAYIYAPQKGADEKAVEQLDQGLQDFAAVIRQQTGKDIAHIPGTGAAGGIAAGLMAFFPLSIQSGMEIVVEASGIKKALVHADVLITGEGKLDAQSGEGKVVGSMAALARQAGVACIAVCGVLQLDEKELTVLGIKKAVAVHDGSSGIAESMKNAAGLLEKISETILES